MPIGITRHDFAQPYTPEEVQELKRIFRHMPSFRDNGYGTGTISSSDLELYYNRIGYYRTPAQHAAYKAYWDRHFNGLVSMDECLEICMAWHDSALLSKQRAKVYDLDRNGFIDHREFGEFVQLCKVHDPKLEAISYSEFVRIADTNRDGKVSIEEFGNWIAKNLQGGMPTDIKRHDFSQPYTPEEVHELKRIFRTIPSFRDTGNGTGTIASSDLALFYTRIGYYRTHEQHAAYKRYWDRHFHGIVSMDECIDICRAWHDSALLSKQRAKVYDLDRNGIIDRREFEEFVELCKVHDPKLEKITYHEFVRIADRNRDGKVSIEEFGDWIAKNLQGDKPVDVTRHDFTKPYTPEEIHELKRIFRHMPSFRDTGYGTGTISSSDLASFYNKIGYYRTPEQHAAYKRYWDRHFGGLVTMDECIDICSVWHDSALLSKQRAKVYDLDRNGFIDRREFEEFVLLCKVHDPKLERISYPEFVRIADTNRDGKVSIEEFGNWIARNLQASTPVDIRRHDFTKPYTAEEVHELKKVFRTMPSFRDTGYGTGTISSSDLAGFYNKIGYYRTPEQNAAYKRYWDRHYNGIVTMDECIEICKVWHDSALLSKQRAKVYDSDGNGFIDRQEFEEFVQLCKLHDPKLARISYPEFVRIADSNRDGKVSIEEFGEWIAKNLQG